MYSFESLFPGGLPRDKKDKGKKGRKGKLSGKNETIAAIVYELGLSGCYGEIGQSMGFGQAQSPERRRQALDKVTGSITNHTAAVILRLSGQPRHERRPMRIGRGGTVVKTTRS